MHTVAVLGAGPSGLSAAKTCLECGLEPTVFEKGDCIGGLWKPGGGVWEGMQTNNSFYSCMFSDFPWKVGTQHFPTRELVHEYLVSYADHFKIHPHVKLNTEVKKIQKKHSQWQVEWLNKEETSFQLFDYVIVCSGIFSKAFIPKIPGIDKFEGDVLHAQNYTGTESFKDKNVIVIGNAFSGSEIACALALEAKQVINVFNRAMWIMPRYVPKTNSEKLPWDLNIYSRAAEERVKNLEPCVINAAKNKWGKSICPAQEVICSDLKVLAPVQDPVFFVISDSYLSEVESGKILPKKGAIKQIHKKSLSLKGGTVIQADAMIFCTGYRTQIPFFEDQDQKLLGFQAEEPLLPLCLYKSVFHPEFSGIGFIGLYRGPNYGVIELQARLICMTFSGKVAMPSKEEMLEGIKQEEQIRDQLPRPQFPHGNYVKRCNELASLIGVLPDLEGLKKQNPPLHEKLFNGPFTTASFRLQGFGSNPEVASKIIDEINQSTLK